MEEIYKYLTEEQASFVEGLLPQIDKNTNILKNEDGSFMELSGSEDMIKKLIKKGVIGKFTSGKAIGYIFNPYIYRKKHKPYTEFRSFFKDAGWTKAKC